MWWDFFLFVTLGPLIGFIIHYVLRNHKDRVREHLEEIREHSHIAC